MKRLMVLLAATAFAASGGLARADSGLTQPAKLTAKAPATYRVAFHTTAGNFEVEVVRSHSPHGADRFYNLVKHGFYDGAAFFRVVPHFVVQFGLNPSPKVNAVWNDAQIPDDPVRDSNRAGTLSFASAGPGTRTTQVFINLADNARLDAMGFSPFGKVTSGFAVVKKIYAGYGEQPDQGQVAAEGSTYLNAQFPKLDRIRTATIVGH